MLNKLTLPRIITVAILAAAALSPAACSKKSKATAVNEPTGSGDKDVGTTKPTTDTASTGETAAANSPELQNVIYFEFDSSDLSAESRAKLDANAEWLKADPSRRLTVEGHTDEVGTPEYNLALGDRRARATKDYLIRLGCDANRIDIITYGEERPASANDAQNRRSMFIATAKQKKS